MADLNLCFDFRNLDFIIWIFEKIARLMQVYKQSMVVIFHPKVNIIECYKIQMVIDDLLVVIYNLNVNLYFRLVIVVL